MEKAYHNNDVLHGFDGIGLETLAAVHDWFPGPASYQMTGIQ